MGLFNNKNKETKEEKALRKEQELMAKYGLDSMTGKDYESVKKIIGELAGTGLMKTGLDLSISTKAEEQVKIAYLSALMEQNWIIIRQLNEISKKLDK